MPGRNIIKKYAEDTYYHAYNRGVNRERIFRDDQDYAVFLHFVKRYLGKEAITSPRGSDYPNFYNQIELQAFCLMPNHFHFLVYQHNLVAMKEAMKCISIAYSMYFNKRYDRVGPICQQRYRAAQIDSDEYLLTISGYIHLNPKEYKHWQWTSLPYYTGDFQTDWVLPGKILALFDGTNYLDYLRDARQHKSRLDAIEHRLAHYNML